MDKQNPKTTVGIAEMQRHYSDFEPGAYDCEREPIHRPLVLQSHGALLALDDENRALYCSDNFPSHLGASLQEVWKGALFDLESKPGQTWERLWQKSRGQWATSPFVSKLHGKSYYFIPHSISGGTILELEPQEDDLDNGVPTLESFKIITEPLKELEELEVLLDCFVKSFQSWSGYDRVMVYQFDQDNHGMVVAEALEAEKEPYLGLRYPASDIPARARALFLSNRTRMIADVNGQTQPLRFNPDFPGAIADLDLSQAQLRSTSPMYIQYLKNMEVAGSMTFALVVREKLWGLVICHHFKPRFLNYEHRKLGELVANFLSQKIKEIEISRAWGRRQQLDEEKKKVDHRILTNFDPIAQLISEGIDFQELLRADGMVICSYSEIKHKVGLVPDEDSIVRIALWLDLDSRYVEEGLYQTRELRKELPENIHLEEEIGGLLAISLAEEGDFKLMWFRQAERERISWGGKPDHKQSETEEEGVFNFGPRRSFARWEEIVETRCRPWERLEEELAQEIKALLLRKLVSWSIQKDEQLRQEKDQLTFVGYHDLQEPLRTIRNYLGLIRAETSTLDSKDLDFYLNRTELAVDRMKVLMLDMLNYSKIGYETEEKLIDLNQVLREINEDLDGMIQKTGALVEIQALPSIWANQVHMKQLFQNLIENAIKYRKANLVPRVVIKARQETSFWVFSVADNGIGIQPQFYSKVFRMFQRLHLNHEYEGTGIGLAICEKIVERLGGKIWIESWEGEGSTFLIRVPENKVQRA